jgi:phosphoinositide-3-kinase regulatory subunit 4
MQLVPLQLAADPAAAVRAAAVHALAAVLPAIETFPASDAKVFPEFVWPSLSGLGKGYVQL